MFLKRKKYYFTALSLNEYVNFRQLFSPRNLILAVTTAGPLCGAGLFHTTSTAPGGGISSPVAVSFL